jgi:TetR/AcrR family transcriptional repressor of lmrAB and yxaGH operons
MSMSKDGKPTAQKRAELEDRLAQVFIEHGYEGASLNRLAAASGLGKASLYHHFPGGKAEMASVLLTRAMARLDKRAFSRLTKKQPARVRLGRFVDAFSSYVGHGTRPCLIAVMDHGASRAVHGNAIRQRFLDWGDRLAATFEETGMKPRRARRASSALLAGLYGNLALARMLDDASLFQRGIRRLKKDLLP